MRNARATGMKACNDCFPNRPGDQNACLRSDLSLDLVFLGRDVPENASPADRLGRNGVQPRRTAGPHVRQPPSAAKGVWLTVSPVTIAQWYALLQHPLPAAATKPEAAARVQQKRIQTELLPRLKATLSTGRVCVLATRAEAHALRQILKPDEAKQKSGSSRASARRSGTNVTRSVGCCCCP